MKKQPVLSSNTSLSYVPTSSRTTSGQTASSRKTSGPTLIGQTTSRLTTSSPTTSRLTTSSPTTSSRTTSGPTTSRLAYSASVYESSFANYTNNAFSKATDTPVIDDIIIGSMDVYDDVIVQMRNDEGYKDDNL